MTGLDRLREFAAGISPITAVCGVTKTAYDMEHVEVVGARLRDFLADIADQIEAEQDERVTRRLEDREAAGWVRGHGGLERVKWLLDWCLSHDSKIEQLDFDYWLSGRVMHELGFDEDIADRDEVERRLFARLVPEGMEWPRYEGGEPVLAGSVAEFGSDDSMTVMGVELTNGGFILHGRNGGIDHPCLVGYKLGERVKRPAPKVLDADGVEIRVGDTVYHVKDGSEMTVYGIEGEWLVVSVGGLARHDIVTHRAPVLAADGRPLREGETVWGTKGGSYQLTSVHDGEVFARHVGGSFGAEVESAGGSGLYRLRADHLTHEQPDSWERWREEWQWPPVKYCKLILGVEYDHDTQLNEAFDAQGDDLVRRAKALAERGQ